MELPVESILGRTKLPMAVLANVKTVRPCDIDEQQISSVSRCFLIAITETLHQASDSLGSGSQNSIL